MVLEGTSTSSPSINHDVLLHCQRSANTEESRQLCQGLQRYPLPVLHPAGLDVLLPSGPPASPLCRRQLNDDTLSNSMMDVSHHNMTRDSPPGLGIPHNNNNSDDNDNSIYTNWPASAQQRSPFRFAAHDSFHRELRTQSGEGKRKRMTDRLCHGWGGEQVDGDGPNQQRTEKGKRSRSPTPPPPPSSSQPVVVVEAASAAAPRLGTRDNHNDTSISSVSVLNGPFSDRLLENDALLDDLLMPSPPPPRCGSPLTTLHPPTTTPSVTTSFSEVVVMAPCRSHTTLQAVGNAAERTLTRDGEEDELKQKKKKTGGLAMTVKELKQQLARAGLLTVGTKTELLHRWQLYQEKIQEEGEAGITHTNNNKNNNNNSIVSNMMETSLVSADATLLWPPPSAAAAAAGGPLLPSSSSPPRTIFRLCSQPSPPRVTAEESVAIPPSRRHVVPTPDAFLDDFQTISSNTHNNNGIIKNTTRNNNNNNNSSSSSDVIATWQLLVDNRERVHGKHDGMLAVLQKQQVPCRSCVLPCGDFMFNIAVARSGTSTGHHDETSSLSVALPPPVGQHGEEEEGGGEEGEANIPLHSHLLPIVVERKTLADLDASIKGSRYLEQRRLLDQSPFAMVVWLIEGMESSFSGSSFNNNSSSTTREGKDLGRFAALSEQQRRVDSACASLSQQKRFVVVRTRNLQESAVFLRQLALSAMEQLRTRMVESTTTSSTSSPLSFSPSSSTSTLLLSSLLLQTDRCLAEAQALQKALRAQTAFPRMLLSIRGCSSGLACMLAAKYGSLHALWALLQLKGPAACDEDADIKKLTVSQKKVVVLLSEFLLAREYF